MPELVINCQNLSCPQPVIRCRQAVTDGAKSIVVLVDNQAACENVSRYLASQNFSLSLDEQGVLTAITARCSAESPQKSTESLPAHDPSSAEKGQAGRKIVLLLTSPVIGTGDDELGAKLMNNFLTTLPEVEPELWQIILLNGAVALATFNSSALPLLKKLESCGAQVLVCGACLTHFRLMPQKAVGKTTNMLDVVTALQLADSVIRP